MNIKFKKIWSVMITALLVMGCELTDLDTEDNPNALTPNQSSIDLLVTSIEVRTAEWFEAGVTDVGMEVTRIKHMFGPLYQNAYTGGTFDTPWQIAYADILTDVQSLRAQALELEASGHLVISNVIEAYVLLVLVDYFGDVPLTEAFQGAANLNPGVTSGSEIYQHALGRLNEAITLAATASTASFPLTPTADIYYGGNFDRWVALANTLKLRYFLNLSLTSPTVARDSINVISGRNIINMANENWQFNYSTTLVNPDSRHPEFSTNYVTGGSDYMSNYYMNLFINGRNGVADPRRRYYFYRQVKTNTTSTNELDCITADRPSHYPADQPFCQLVSGYWGRDHGNNDGIPPDNLLRTIWGVYPVGGRFDTDASGRGTQTAGARGAGISPLMLNFYVDFMRAEAVITLGANGDARALLESAVRGSINKVVGFPAEVGYALNTTELGLVPTAAVIDTYVAGVLAAYDAATTADARLEVIAIEYLKALFGNGVEAYNMYRRTGHPTGLQPTLDPVPGDFIRSFLYANNFVTRNSSVSQKPFPGTQVLVFWDNGSRTLD